MSTSGVYPDIRRKVRIRSFWPTSVLALNRRSLMLDRERGEAALRWTDQDSGWIHDAHAVLEGYCAGTLPTTGPFRALRHSSKRCTTTKNDGTNSTASSVDASMPVKTVIP